MSTVKSGFQFIYFPFLAGLCFVFAIVFILFQTYFHLAGQKRDAGDVCRTPTWLKSVCLSVVFACLTFQFLFLLRSKLVLNVPVYLISVLFYFPLHSWINRPWSKMLKRTIRRAIIEGRVESAGSNLIEWNIFFSFSIFCKRISILFLFFFNFCHQKLEW